MNFSHNGSQWDFVADAWRFFTDFKYQHKSEGDLAKKEGQISCGTAPENLKKTQDCNHLRSDGWHWRSFSYKFIGKKWSNVQLISIEFLNIPIAVLVWSESSQQELRSHNSLQHPRMRQWCDDQSVHSVSLPFHPHSIATAYRISEGSMCIFDLSEILLMKK